MAITAGGIGSGIDVNGLVSQLVSAEGDPVTQRLDNKQASIQQDLSAFGTLKSALSRFQDSVKALQTPDNFLERNATSSDESLFTVSADKDAVRGSYAIEVQQLAQAAKVRSDSFQADEALGTGTLTLSLGSDSFEITIDPENNTLAGIQQAINSATDNPGILASVINLDDGNQRLILTSEKLGETNQITLSASDDNASDGVDLGQLQTLTTINAAQDAQILIDGQQISRDSNTIDDVIDGVTFTLLKADTETVATANIELDNSAVKSRVESFVAAYNTLNTTINNLSSYNADTGAAGALLGDSALRGVQTQLRQTLTSAINGVDISTLAELGVTTNQDNGNLQIDSERLDNAINQNFSAVADLFASENGLAVQLAGVLTRYTSTDGILDLRTNGLRNQLEDIGDSRERLALRLEGLEARYRAQFTAMDTLVAQLQSLSGYLDQQLANLPLSNINRDR
ncbi:Flagellar hook-associated protein FliD [Methylophaga frappieri]|uniref:Flagellar hook-associated protein 2 n=1 Tax=Methylophaga frappieri (strain ATCC BAA-2434 / DSM 25690 / JAM7) TaxID=754477 RepID=I1YKN1_METFJ|nr:flagellar filament capping protein FliD [Methylophaga frappieri]AFJ03474.1 Flagellar hook-associated protein FliD [Methylophaga frappieri]